MLKKEITKASKDEPRKGQNLDNTYVVPSKQDKNAFKKANMSHIVDAKA